MTKGQLRFNITTWSNRTGMQCMQTSEGSEGPMQKEAESLAKLLH